MSPPALRSLRRILWEYLSCQVAHSITTVSYSAGALAEDCETVSSFPAGIVSTEAGIDKPKRRCTE